MARIEDYAIIGNTHTAALVSLTGSIDWMCVPRFDSASCFAAMLDQDEGGFWSIHPEADATARRRYIGDTLILETTFETDSGAIAIVDLMPVKTGSDPDDPRTIETDDSLLRVVRGLRGAVDVVFEFTPRFDYGATEPWLRRSEDLVMATAGESTLDLQASVDLEIDGWFVRGRFTVSAGEEVPFLMTYRESHEEPGEPSLESWKERFDATEEFWMNWSGRCEYDGERRDEVVRSLVTLKALTYSPTGGIVAAATTSLPEKLRSSRNWDYRFCWLRDASLALEVLIETGYRQEAAEWHDWLIRAGKGNVSELQVMYSATGERRIQESLLDWLDGYEGSKPVRVGNAAVDQFQLDIYGEAMDLFHVARRAGIDPPHAWGFQRELVDVVCDRWMEPDNGIWEFRGPRRHFVHSKAMAWVALDRAIRAAEDAGKDGPIDRWHETRDAIYNDIMERGIGRRGCFVMSYGTEEVDASLLRLPLVGFAHFDDEPMRATLEAIERDLLHDGLVRRYRSGKIDDYLPRGEGTFFLCTFWFVACLVLMGREDYAEEIFTGALEKANDVGLLSEQFGSDRLLGNFPQAFSHFGMINAALAVEQGHEAPGLQRWR